MPYPTLNRGRSSPVFLCIFLYLTRNRATATFVKQYERMAYNRINLLTLMIDVQNITLQHTAQGVTQEYVYKNIIFPTYRISRRTYYSYLSTSAKSDLRKIKEAQQLQTSLF